MEHRAYGGAVKEKISDPFHILKELYDQPIFAEEKIKEIQELEFLPKYISKNEMNRAGDAPTPKGRTPFLRDEEEEDIWGSYTNSSSSRYALQPHPTTSPLNSRSFRALTLRTDDPPPSLSSRSSSFTHSKTRRTSPTPQTNNHSSSYGLSSKIASSHAYPEQSYTSSSQSSTTQICSKQGINPRFCDALDLFIPAKSKLQVGGDEKQVSAWLEQHSTGIEEEEQIFRLVGKHLGDYRSCKEAENLQVRWIKHYSSQHKILLVGEGDFSFSAALAEAFDSGANIAATSLDSIEFLSKNYSRALSNIDKLQSLGAKVKHNVDATNMANISRFKFMLFDRLVYNFPLAGFFNDEKLEDQIRRHQKLVQLFLENAKKMIHIEGEIHITHKSNRFFKDWDLEFIASRVGLQLIEEVPFNFKDYPGYRTKYGFGGDKNFYSNPSKTYKFGHKKLLQNSKYIFYNYEYYVVYQGHKSGIFKTWKETLTQITNYPKPFFKGFIDLVPALEQCKAHLGINYFISPLVKQILNHQLPTFKLENNWAFYSPLPSRETNLQ